ncbi:XRE family transcriptional regulator [Leptospira yasudae]|uniref:XRE family transcriptional regulator n=1 Tax=Leptospira yasudae TaxID=2202201 RepID=A0A6N4QX31_9LEPT|nr:XRE family transcriptional regulator [Leptospira yasudae]MBW0434963.1 XRE family transcriptional regulator [Leptospira yasudae]TGL81444.1 XRE family transcriptional regulator [Leptospira yasudae]TGL81713.1 XRE family transcriptional regulator [Leptospira yasudae]TGL88089.1 XRE family transcriptional regulator [Leptospira yasudae]
MSNKIITIPIENVDFSTPGKRLRYAIKNILAMNDEDFAISVGKSQNYISYICNDKRPLLDKLAAEIESVHRISGLWLIKGEGYPEVNTSSEGSSETVKKMKKRDFLWNKIANDKVEDIFISFFNDVSPEMRNLVYQMIRAISKDA